MSRATPMSVAQADASGRIYMVASYAPGGRLGPALLCLDRASGQVLGMVILPFPTRGDVDLTRHYAVAPGGGLVHATITKDKEVTYEWVDCHPST